MEQVFIEDYTVAFLKQIKEEASETPIRLALFGYEEKSNNDVKFIIYGAACEEEDHTMDETGQEFFAGYSLIGFVNVYNSDKDHFTDKNILVEKEGLVEKDSLTKYHIFFDENEAMQDYLLFYNARRKTSRGTINPAKNTGMHGGFWAKLKMLLLGMACIIMAVIISIIDDYSKMKDFAGAAERVIEFIEETR